MLVGQLSQKHPTYNADMWADYEALYEGGQKWRERVRRFIQRNPQEPEDTYELRCKAAHYRSYLGAIVDYFVAYLFTQPFIARCAENEEPCDPDPYYSHLKEDCDGTGTDLVEMLRDRLTKALLHKQSWILATMPSDGGVPAYSLADWIERKLGYARLKAVNAVDVLDYERDETGNLLWAITYEKTRPRDSPSFSRDMIVHTWRVYDRREVETFQVLQNKGEYLHAEMNVSPISKVAHGFDRVPLIELCVPSGLWIANRLESAQREHTILANALTWLIRRTCYAMPVLHLKDDKRGEVFGTGYYLKLGVEEKLEWSAPPSTPFDAIRNEVDSQKDEIHRIVHQMAQGVNNNAAAVGRSGESKAADAEATRVMLEAIGSHVRETTEQLYNMLSKARGDKVVWSISGLSGYSVEDVEGMLNSASNAIRMVIPSETWGKEVRKRAALALVPEADQTTRDAIVAEIEANYHDESVTSSSLLKLSDLLDSNQEAGDHARLRQ